MQPGSRISDFNIGRGDIMANQMTKSAAKKAGSGKSKTRTKTSSAASSTVKTAKSPVKATTKKVSATKSPAAAAQTKKSKTSAVKNATATAAKIKAPVKKAASAKTIPMNKPATKPSPEERYRMVETAAYFIAEQHGFQGRNDEHWAAAEREIAAKLGQ